jgi:hypothetical protein
MKTLITSGILCLLFAACTEKPATPTNTEAPPTKAIILDLLKTTHNNQQWFVPINKSLEDVTPEQATWLDESGNHSIGQLANHIAFWNERQLMKFNDQPEKEFSGNNDETFNAFDKASWDKTVKKVDSVMVAFEKAVEAADEAKLKEWYPTLANISAHNAYHTGQIIYIRKMKGWWDSEKGVK